MTTNKEKIDAIISNPKYGTQVQVENVSQSLNDYGDATDTITATSTIYAIMWDLVDENGNYLGAGLQTEGDMQMIVSADETINNQDIVTYNGKTYRVQRKLVYPLGGTNLANQVILKEQI